MTQMAKKNEVSVDSLVAAVVAGLQEKKGNKIVSLDLRNLNSAFADFFVIAHGTSNRQVDALADSVEEIVRKTVGDRPAHREGQQESDWVLLDYINVVVHIFSEEKRDFYAIEELWGDAVRREHADH
ncbi:MAG: ribosome silencing factor [Bacteroidia bacterium]